MKIKELFKSSSLLLHKNFKFLLGYIFISSTILIGTRFLLSLISEFLASIAIFFLFFPLLFSLKFIVRKIVEQKELENKDLYFGFRNYGKALGSLSNQLVRNLLFIFLGGLVGAIIGGLVSVPIFLSSHSELISDLETFIINNDQVGLQNYINSFINNTEIVYFSIGISVITFLGSSLFYSLWGHYKNYSVYIYFDSTFDANGCNTLSKRYSKNNAASLFLINFIFGLGVVLIFSIDLVLALLFEHLLLNALISLIIRLLIGYILFLILLVNYEIIYYNSYNYYFRNDVLEKQRLFIEKLNQSK